MYQFNKKECMDGHETEVIGLFEVLPNFCTRQNFVTNEETWPVFLVKCSIYDRRIGE